LDWISDIFDKTAKLRLLKIRRTVWFDLDPSLSELGEFLKGLARSGGAQDLNFSVSGPATVIRCVTSLR